MKRKINNNLGKMAVHDMMYKSKSAWDRGGQELVVKRVLV